jgi:hypothetical protein
MNKTSKQNTSAESVRAGAAADVAGYAWFLAIGDVNGDGRADQARLNGLQPGAPTLKANLMGSYEYRK